MATVMDRPKAKSAKKQTAPESLDAFLAQLGELSRRYGLAVSDGAFLYIMEQEDYARSYTASDESALSFA